MGNLDTLKIMQGSIALLLFLLTAAIATLQYCVPQTCNSPFQVWTTVAILLAVNTVLVRNIFKK